MQKQLELLIDRLEAYYTEHAAQLNLAETFEFFDALAAIKEEAQK